MKGFLTTHNFQKFFRLSFMVFLLNISLIHIWPPPKKKHTTEVMTRRCFFTFPGTKIYQVRFARCLSPPPAPRWCLLPPIHDGQPPAGRLGTNKRGPCRVFGGRKPQIAHLCEDDTIGGEEMLRSWWHESPILQKAIRNLGKLRNSPRKGPRYSNLSSAIWMRLVHFLTLYA